MQIIIKMGHAFVEAPEASRKPFGLTREREELLEFILGQKEEARILHPLVLHQIVQVVLQLVYLSWHQQLTPSLDKPQK